MSRAKNLTGAKPKASLRVDAGSDQVKKVRFKVPKSLRFADGKAFTNGTPPPTTRGELDDDVLDRKRARGDGRDALGGHATC